MRLGDELTAFEEDMQSEPRTGHYQVSGQGISQSKGAGCLKWVVGLFSFLFIINFVKGCITN